MNRKYISLAAVIGAFILCLIAVPSAFGAGEVSFIDPDAIGGDNDGYLTDPTPDEQKWARQGGFIGLMYEDDRLNQPVRRVLIPYLDTTFVVRMNYVVLADIEAHSNTITITVTPTETLTLAVNDYVMVGEYTVRKVLEITAPTAPDTDYVVALDRPFYENASQQIVHKIKPSVIEAAVRRRRRLRSGLAQQLWLVREGGRIGVCSGIPPQRRYPLLSGQRSG